MKKQTHHIQRQALMVDFSTDEKARSWHKTAPAFYYTKMLPLLNEVLDKQVPADHFYSIEHLDINVGTVDENELLEAFVKSITLALTRLLTRDTQSIATNVSKERIQSEENIVITESKEHLIACFYYFLDFGILPWNSSLKSLSRLEAALEQEIGLKNVILFTDFQKRLYRASTRRRLYFQFSPTFWDEICHQLYKPIMAYLSSIRKAIMPVLMTLAINKSAQKKLKAEFSDDLKVWIGQKAPAHTQHWPQHYIGWIIRKAMPFLKPVGEKAILKAMRQGYILKDKSQTNNPATELVTTLKTLIASVETQWEGKNIPEQHFREDTGDQSVTIRAEDASSVLPAAGQVKHLFDEPNSEDKDTAQDELSAEELETRPTHLSEHKEAKPIESVILENEAASENEKTGSPTASEKALRSSVDKGVKPDTIQQQEDKADTCNQHSTVVGESDNKTSSGSEQKNHLPLRRAVQHDIISEENKADQVEKASAVVTPKQPKTKSVESTILTLSETAHAKHSSEHTAKETGEEKKDSHKIQQPDHHLAQGKVGIKAPQKQQTFPNEKKGIEPLAPHDLQEAAAPSNKENDTMASETVAHTDKSTVARQNVNEENLTSEDANLYESSTRASERKPGKQIQEAEEAIDQLNNLSRIQGKPHPKNKVGDIIYSGGESQIIKGEQPKRSSPTRKMSAEGEEKPEGMISGHSPEKFISGVNDPAHGAHAEIEKQRKEEEVDHPLPDKTKEINVKQNSPFEEKSQIVQSRLSGQEFLRGTSSLEDEMAMLTYQFAKPEVYYLKDAGIVLTWPYLARLFKHLGYVENNSFKNRQLQQQAVHLLAYIASGLEQCEEPTLVMPKFLCAWPFAMPIMKDLTLTEEEKSETDQMLRGVIHNWPILKNTSLDGLRSSFFDREGKLFKEDEQWKLIIEQKSYDMLLEHLPYTLSIIKLPWMTHLLKVDWAS